MFKELNIGTTYSRKVNNTRYEGLTLSKNEQKEYPYATLGFIEVDIYNKTDNTLNITSMDLLYKENDKVINTETLDLHKCHSFYTFDSDYLVFLV